MVPYCRQVATPVLTPLPEAPLLSNSEVQKAGSVKGVT